MPLLNQTKAKSILSHFIGFVKLHLWITPKTEHVRFHGHLILVQWCQTLNLPYSTPLCHFFNKYHATGHLCIRTCWAASSQLKSSNRLKIIIALLFSLVMSAPVVTRHLHRTPGFWNKKSLVSLCAAESMEVATEYLLLASVCQAVGVMLGLGIVYL